MSKSTRPHSPRRLRSVLFAVATGGALLAGIFGAQAASHDNDAAGIFSSQTSDSGIFADSGIFGAHTANSGIFAAGSGIFGAQSANSGIFGAQQQSGIFSADSGIF